jgi:hypothetical protein
MSEGHVLGKANIDLMLGAIQLKRVHLMYINLIDVHNN